MAQAVAIAPRLKPPSDFKGTPAQWRVLTEAIWPNAKSPEAISLAIAYCGARRLDPMKRPVHIVPMYNSSLRREVETVWPGINELLTTAARSRDFAGVDEPRWGPDETRTFHGVREERNGVTRDVAITVTFPEWCSVTVWRRVHGERVAFSQPVYWIEAYRRVGFRSELPNEMWATRARGQLHKCALAAALRMGFPEDIGGEMTAEEMEGGEIEAGGVTIDGAAEAPATETPADRDQQTDAAPPPSSPPQGEAVAGIELLEDENTGRWLKALGGLLAAAASLDEIADIAGHHSVQRALQEAPTLVRRNIEDDLRKAHERLAPGKPTEPAVEDWNDPRVAELLAEIEEKDLIALTGLPTDAQWRVKLRDLFPPDRDIIDEAIATRMTILKSKQEN